MATSSNQPRNTQRAIEPARPSPGPWPPAETASWPEQDRRLVGQLRPESLPRHVAIIMDGNGRWARRRGLLDRIRGHEAGIDSVRETLRTCGTLGIDALTLYAFSRENWSRPSLEVSALMRLLERFLVEERPELMENAVRVRAIGSLGDLPQNVRSRLEETIRLTENNPGITLTLALSYGARDEILRAVRAIASDVAGGALDPAGIDEAAFSARLDTAALPDPDFLIRTSGEVRISNFLLWQIAYTEFFVTEVLWPDFRRTCLLDALLEYQRRDRRFGQVRETDLEPKGP